MINSVEAVVSNDGSHGAVELFSDAEGCCASSETAGKDKEASKLIPVR